MQNKKHHCDQCKCTRDSMKETEFYNPTDTTLEAMVRDFSRVQPVAKSEIRRRIREYAIYRIKQALIAIEQTRRAGR